jgi:hypothetical protein
MQKRHQAQAVEGNLPNTVKKVAPDHPTLTAQVELRPERPRRPIPRGVYSKPSATNEWRKTERGVNEERMSVVKKRNMPHLTATQILNAGGKGSLLLWTRKQTTDADEHES